MAITPPNMDIDERLRARRLFAMGLPLSAGEVEVIPTRENDRLDQPYNRKGSAIIQSVPLATDAALQSQFYGTSADRSQTKKVLSPPIPSNAAEIDKRLEEISVELRKLETIPKENRTAGNLTEYGDLLDERAKIIAQLEVLSEKGVTISTSPNAPNAKQDAVAPVPGVSLQPNGNKQMAVPTNKVSGGLNLGAAGTNVNSLANYGALAKQLGQQLYPQRVEDPKDKWLTAFQFFANMAAAASKPGATAIGAAGAAGATTVKTLLEERKQKRAEDLAATQMGAKLIGTLAKPKTGVPKVVDMGPAMATDGTTPLKNDDGVVLHKFNVFNYDGTIRSTYNAPRKTGMAINLSGQKSFETVSGKKAAEQFANQLEASDKAFGAISEMNTLLNILADPNFETGVYQSGILPIKQLFVSLPKRARDVLGYTEKDFEEVASAEAFQALGYSIVLAKVEQMKGALSNKELGFLAAQGPTLSKTKDGNRLIIALSQQQLAKTAQFQEFSLNWQETNGEVKNKLDYQKLIKDFRNQDFMKENPYQYMMRIAKKEISKRILNAGGKIGADEEIEEGSISSDAIRQISNDVSAKFGLITLERIFKDRDDKGKVWR